MTLCVCPFVAGKEPSPAGKDYYFSRSCGLDPYACGHESHALSTCCFVFTGAEEVMGRRQQQQQPHGNDDPSGLCMAHMGLDRWSLGAQSMFLGSSSSWEGHPPITHPPHVCPPVLDGPAWLTWPVCVCVPCAEQEDDQLRHEDDGDDGDSSGKRGCHIVWGGGLLHGEPNMACAWRHAPAPVVVGLITRMHVYGAQKTRRRCRRRRCRRKTMTMSMIQVKKKGGEEVSSLYSAWQACACFVSRLPHAHIHCFIPIPIPQVT